MRIEKVKLHSTKGKEDTDPKVTVIYSNNRGENGSDQIVYASSDEPLKTFRSAMQSLQDDVNTLLGWPDDDAGDISVRSISVKYIEGGRIGLNIGGTKVIAGSRSPFNFVTPYLEQATNKEDAVGMLSKKIAFKVEKIIEEAVRYVKGERAQAQIFDAPSAPAASESPAPAKERSGEIPQAPEKKEKPAGRARNSKLKDSKLKLHTHGSR